MFYIHSNELFSWRNWEWPCFPEALLLKTVRRMPKLRRDIDELRTTISDRLCSGHGRQLCHPVTSVGPTAVPAHPECCCATVFFMFLFRSHDRKLQVTCVLLRRFFLWICSVAEELGCEKAMGLSNQAKKIKLPFEKYDKMYKKKNTRILKLLIVGPSCEECPSDKGIEFLLITYLCVCVCARVLIYKIIRISKIKAKLLRRAHTIFLCFFFSLWRTLCCTWGFQALAQQEFPRQASVVTVVQQQNLCVLNSRCAETEVVGLGWFSSTVDRSAIFPEWLWII